MAGRRMLQRTHAPGMANMFINRRITASPQTLFMTVSAIILKDTHPFTAVWFKNSVNTPDEQEELNAMANPSNPKLLNEYNLLGRTGLRVSPLCLGTMTFGTDWGWGADDKESRRIFDCYLGHGGNFIDTANGYTNGHSEEMLGQFMKESGNRDRIVLATKYTASISAGDPNASGNGRKNIYQSLDASLKRLQTDYIDLYWMHMWDGLTPVEEVLETFHSLVHAGKIRYFGISDVPAWYVTRAQTIAELKSYTKLAALQLEYSLVERNIEREHIPVALELGMGVIPWSPLGSGFLTGKYRREENSDIKGEGRLKVMPLDNRFTERNWLILDKLNEIASKLGKSPSQVALNWIVNRPGVSSTIVGASKLTQLEDNLQALEFEIPDALYKELDEVGRPELIFPYTFFEAERRKLFVDVAIHRTPRWK